MKSITLFQGEYESLRGNCDDEGYVDGLGLGYGCYGKGHSSGSGYGGGGDYGRGGGYGNGAAFGSGYGYGNSDGAMDIARKP